MRASILNRKVHRWGAILTAIPVLLVVTTGVLLQLKKQSSWIQPPTQKGSTSTVSGNFDDILQAARAGKHANISSWDDVDRLDVRPSKGIVKIKARNDWELQVDLETKEILQESYRRSDFIESLHDGSFFGLKFWIFLPSAVILLVLWGTGLYLFFLPYIARRNYRRKMQAKENSSES
ncbi:MAG: putative iron-regulated membrane protein [Planctomycetota bacterium]|jgi:uncharacterized iron-regulated membrane protein